MTITILDYGNSDSQTGMWCHFLVSNAGGGLMYSHAVNDLPFNISEAAIKANLVAREATLLSAAQALGVVVDIFDNDGRLTIKLVISLALLVRDEINAVRLLIRNAVPAVAGQPDYQNRTLAQLKTGIRDKFQAL